MFTWLINAIGSLFGPKEDPVDPLARCPYCGNGFNQQQWNTREVLPSGGAAHNPCPR